MMRLTTLSRYGVRSLFDMAYYGGGKPVSASDISKRQDISLNYIGQIFLKLKRAGLINSIRGRTGGYVLSRPPEDITLLEIIEAVEGPILLVNCPTNITLCSIIENCVTRPRWRKAGELLKDYFGKVSIDDLIRDAEANGIER